MNILGLDTCFPALSVAVATGAGTPYACVRVRTEPMATGHAERLVPLIEELLGEARLPLAEVECVAVTCGPGSFTGTRIGVAAARALRLALGVAVVPFSSLEAIALSAETGPVAQGEELLVAIDAHRGEAYVQRFHGVTRDAVGQPQIVPATDFARLGGDRPIYVVGTAAPAIAAAVTAVGGVARARAGMIFPDMAAAVVRAANRVPATRPVEPLYLRPPDAKPQDGKSLARAET
jgi:tRNA threonylcarbamoyladenosine biosynthesis protein TsaB